MKLGSLFDGIGGFPYSAQRHGITPVWASEIETACINITRRHFPRMTHLGDITKINGAEIEPVDIITFGSPCQDLSVAGKRAGMKHEDMGDDETTRSGLFMEAMRIIWEMRVATNGRYPTWAIWENVPGALSSNDGLDFRAVLQPFTGTEIPVPPSGRWATAGMVRGGRCDIGWRVLDAQFWGVPQRRRRVFLVADFGGRRAGQVLFEPESLRGHLAPCGKAGEEIAGGAGNGFTAAADGRTDYLTGWDTQERRIFTAPPDAIVAGFDIQQITSPSNRSSVTFGAPQPTLCKAGWPHAIIPNDQGGQVMEVSEGVVGTLRAEMHGNVPAVLAACVRGREGCAGGGKGPLVSYDKSLTLATRNDQAVFFFENYRHSEYREGAGTLRAAGGDCAATGQGNAETLTDQAPTLTCANEQPYIANNKQVRRLMPVECERLQCFQDEWTAYGVNEKGQLVKISDSKRYAAIGNSVATVCTDYLAAGIIRATAETERNTPPPSAGEGGMK